MGKKIILLTLLSASLSVAIGWGKIIYLTLLLLSYVICLLQIFEIKFDPKLKAYLSLALLPFFISLFISLPYNYVFNETYDYGELNILGRLINFIGLIFVVFYLNTLLHKQKLKLKEINTFYLYSCLIIIITAIWQALSLYTSLPISFPFDTRSILHGASNSYAVEKRLTGIAEEPGFLAAVLADVWVFSYIVYYGKKKKRILIKTICVIITLLTFSPSAYVILLLIILYELSFKVRKIYKLIFVALAGMTILLFVVKIGGLNSLGNKNLGVFSYIIERFEGVEDSGRFVIIFKAVGSMFSDAFTLFLGNGFKTFEIISTHYTYINVDTSNSLFVDVFFEAGLIGLSFLIGFFIYIYKKTRMIKSYKYRCLGKLLIMDVIISGFFRADYTTLRYFLIIFIIFKLINHNSFVRKQI